MLRTCTFPVRSCYVFVTLAAYPCAVHGAQPVKRLDYAAAWSRTAPLNVMATSEASDTATSQTEDHGEMTVRRRIRARLELSLQAQMSLAVVLGLGVVL